MDGVQVMPGWRFKRGPLEFKVFFGLELEKHRLWPDDPTNRLRGRTFGLRFAVDFWYEPTPATMVAADASLSSVASNQSARAGFGWRVIDDQFYVGPEIAGLRLRRLSPFRLGAHITSMKTDNTEWSAAAGWARDSDRRSSPYVRLGC